MAKWTIPESRNSKGSWQEVRITELEETLQNVIDAYIMNSNLEGAIQVAQEIIQNKRV